MVKSFSTTCNSKGLLIDIIGLFQIKFLNKQINAFSYKVCFEIDKIWEFLQFQVNGALKCTFDFPYYSHNILNF
jgi:hypothetical protein